MSCWTANLRGSLFYLNLEELLVLGHQATEALLDSGIKVTRNATSTVSQRKLKWSKVWLRQQSTGSAVWPHICF